MKARNVLITAVLIVGSLSAVSGGATPTRFISEEGDPAKVITAITRDGQKATAVLRMPPGKGPFPALVFLHGGVRPLSLEQLKSLHSQPNHRRFLSAGYVVVNATFRSRAYDPQTTGALTDCLAVIGHVRKMPEVDPQSVVLWGVSGGGSLALELAGETPLCGIVVDEPATVLFTGMFRKENLAAKPPYGPQMSVEIMKNTKHFYTPALERLTREKIRRIRCPVLVACGNTQLSAPTGQAKTNEVQYELNKFNNDVFIPELKRAGKNVTIISFPKEPHGFSIGTGSPQAVEKFFEECQGFFQRYLGTQPKKE